MRKLCLAWFIFLVACHETKMNSNESIQVFSQFPSELTVSLEDHFPFDKGSVIALFPTDSSLFLSVVDGLKDHFFYEYNLPHKTMTATYLQGGRKKNQVMSVYTFGLHKKKLLWAHDIPMAKIVTVPVKGSGNDTAQPVQDYALPEGYKSVQLMDSSRLLAHELMNVAKDNPYKMQILDLASGKVLSEFGRVDNTPEDIPVHAWKSAYAGFLFLKPEEDKAVVASWYADQVEIFDLSTKKNTIIKGPENFKAEFAFVKGTSDIMRSAKTRFAFLNGVATTKHIYLLYSGENNLTAHRNQAKYIYVYDWDGNPIRKITLDRYISAFTVSDDEKMIYAFDLSRRHIVKSKNELP